MRVTGLKAYVGVEVANAVGHVVAAHALNTGRNADLDRARLDRAYMTQ